MKPKFRSLIAAFAPLSRSSLIVCASLCATAASQADQTWTSGGTVDDSWVDAGNWSGAAIPVATDLVTFDVSSTTNLDNYLDADFAINGLAITSPPSPVSINGYTLTLGSAGINMSATTRDLTLYSDVMLGTSAAQDWSVASGRTLTVDGTLARANFGTVNFDTSAGGVVNIPSGTASSRIQGATINQSDFAALDGGNDVVEGNTVLTYTPNPAVTGTALPNLNGVVDWMDVTNSNDAPYGITAFRFDNNTYMGGGIRFNTPHAAGLDWVADIKSGRPLYYYDNLQILVSPAVDTNVRINGGQYGMRANASSSSIDISNFSTNSLTITCEFTEGGGKPGRLGKNGGGDLILTNDWITLTNGYSVNEGNLSVGEGGTTGRLLGGGIHIASGATLSLNRSDTALDMANAISGDGAVNQVGSGTSTLSGINTHTGGTNILAGALAAGSAANFGTGPVTINGGAIRLAAAFDASAAAGAVVIGSTGGGVDTNGFDTTFSNSFASGSTGSLTKYGAGTLTLAATNDYSGGTSVDTGALFVSASGATGSGTVTVNTGATLGGTGTITGTANVTTGGNLTPGASVGTLTVGGLDLDAGATATFEFNGANDTVAVSTSGGLTIDGGDLTLVEEGTSIALATPGTYNLITYSGAIGGTGVSSLSVANPQAGLSYTFGSDGSNVTLTIAVTGIVSEWTTDGSGSWADAGNWSGAIPTSAGATANFTTSLGGPATVSLNGARTVGAVTFLSDPNGYTIIQGSGGTLTFNNGGSDAAIINNGGSHIINAPVSLASNTVISSNSAAENLTLGGVVSGAGSLSKTGPGNLFLTGSNSFTGELSLTGGTTTFANGGLGAGDLLISNASLVWDTGNSQDISNRTIAFGDDPVTFDVGGNDVSLANPIGEFGIADFTKAGGGSLTLVGDATFSGEVMIAAGALQLGAGGTSGMLDGDIINNGQLVISRSDDVWVPNLISGTGSLDIQGTGEVELSSDNTFTGLTTISTGSIRITSSLALQGSTLDYDSAGGTLSLDYLTAVTLGGLQGDLGLDLINDDLLPVALTIGGNGDSTDYMGILSGTGASLTKVGTGSLTLSAAQTYDGATNINEGTLEVATGCVINTTSANSAGTAELWINGGTLTASAASLFYGGGPSFGIFVDDGTANFNGGLISSQNDGSHAVVYGGFLNTTDVELRRTNSYGNAADPNGGANDSGLVVYGGEANLSGALNMATGNSSASALVDGGILNVTGTVNVGMSAGSDRWSVFEVRSGDFTCSEATDGVVVSHTNVNKGQFLVSGGVSNVEKITLGGLGSTGIARLTLSGGELYVGSGGLVTNGTSTTQVYLQGGELGASAPWSSSLPVELNGGINAVFSASDAGGSPFDISLSGNVTGASGLVKYGDGALTLSGSHTYAGETSVNEGTLSVQSPGFDDASPVHVELADGAALDLDFTGSDIVGGFYIDGAPQAAGTYGSTTNATPGIIQTAAITGDGLLVVAGSSAYDAWATANSLTAGVNDGSTQDPEFDGIENVLEFVLGGDPLASDTSILPVLTTDASNFIFTFTREDDSEAEVTLNFQYGSDLSGWTDVAIGADNGSSGPEVDIVEDGANADVITVTIPNGANTELFGRLQAAK